VQGRCIGKSKLEGFGWRGDGGLNAEEQRGTFNIQHSTLNIEWEEWEEWEQWEGGDEGTVARAAMGILY